MSRYHLTDGIVIRRYELPNGDAIVTLFGEAGKWRGKVKKGKRLGGNLGRLSLFHDVSVQHYLRSDDDLSIITQVQLNGALPGLSHPAVYPYAHVLAELLDKLSVDVHLGEDMYAYLASGLRGLSEHNDPEAVALVYAWKLLQQAGLSPRLARCALCGDAEVGERFDIGAGGMSCPRCDSGLRLSPALIADLQALHSRTVRQMLDRELPERSEHWTLLQRYLSFHVAELKSLGVARRLSAETVGDADALSLTVTASTESSAL